MPFPRAVPKVGKDGDLTIAPVPGDSPAGRACLSVAGGEEGKKANERSGGESGGGCRGGCQRIPALHEKVSWGRLKTQFKGGRHKATRYAREKAWPGKKWRAGAVRTGARTKDGGVREGGSPPKKSDCALCCAACAIPIGGSWAQRVGEEARRRSSGQRKVRGAATDLQRGAKRRTTCCRKGPDRLKIDAGLEITSFSGESKSDRALR